jgi:DNA-binding CsgD family transcriptional regulator/tetratricopeptide (TPR) repeat protein
MELDRLQAALAQARSGEPQFLLISGEAGVGKTRLLDEMGQRAERKGNTVLVGGCLDIAEGAAPLTPFVEALRTLPDLLPAEELDQVIGPARESIGLILPGAGLGGAPDPAWQAGAQGRLFEHLLGMLVRLAQRAPLVLVIEDIQWADRSTIDLLRFLVRNLRMAAVFLIVTYRTDEPVVAAGLRSLLAELERSGRVERLDLARFNRAELADQLQAIRGAPASSELVDRIYRLSDGNAFYTEELAAVRPDGRMMPETHEATLLARVDELSEAARTLLRAASVTGAHASERLLVSVTELDKETVPGALHELLDRGFLVRQQRGSNEVIAFRHALLQEGVYRQLLPGERQRLHEACARFLPREQAGDRDVVTLSQLAWHWSETGDTRRALRASVLAGKAAEAGHLTAGAAEQYQRALRLWQSVPNAAAEAGLDRVELLERAASVETGIASAAAIDHIAEAIALVDARDDPVRAGLLHVRLGRYRWISGDGAGALTAYEDAMRLVPTHPPTIDRARVTAGLGQMLMILARFEESAPLCREALSAARAAGARDIEAHALNTLGQDVFYLGDIDGGLALLNESLALALEIGSAEDAARAYINLLDTLKISARFDEAIRFAPEAFEYSRTHGLTSVNGVSTLTYAAWAAYRSGRWADAAWLLESARMHPADGVTEIEVHVFGAMLQAGTGEFERARSGLARAAELLVGAVDTEFIAPFAEALAELELWSGNSLAAGRAIAPAVERVASPGSANISRIGPLYWLGLRAAADSMGNGRSGGVSGDDALRREGNRCTALMAEAASQIATHRPMLSYLAEPYLRLCEAEATRLGRAAEPDAWNVAADALFGLGLRYPGAYARWRQAQAVLSLRHGRAGARAPLHEAAETCLELGAQPLGAAVAETAQRARLELGASAPPEPAEPAARYGLTRREREVLALLADGRTNREIAGELFITEKTAGGHVSNILGKLGVAGRTEAASVALRDGLVGR